MVHARLIPSAQVEICLGESKLYKQASRAIAEAIKSVKDHIEAGFLTNENLILGPQIPKNTPRYEEILALFKHQSTLDEFLKHAVFAIGILCDSDAVNSASSHSQQYLEDSKKELEQLSTVLANSGLFLPDWRPAALVSSRSAQDAGRTGSPYPNSRTLQWI